MALADSPLLADVSLDAPWELVEIFSRHPRWKPEDVNAACDLIVERLARHGVPVTVHEPEIYLSIPFSAEVLTYGETYRAKPPSYSRSIPEGLSAPLVYVPASYSKSIGTLFDKSADAALSAAERLRGKIVISEGFAFPGKILEFEQKGALGVIAVNPGADAHWGICTSIWGTPDLDDFPRKPKIPVVAVSNPDGQALLALAADGETVTLKTHLEEGWYRQKVPVVEIPGAVEPDKFVLVHGHYDSWDVGVGDNATGDATLLELARVLWKHRGALKRSVRIAWWPGHSTGRYAGSTWYADAFALDLDRNCVAQINCDSPGCRWATVFEDISWMSEAEGFVQGVIKEVTGLAAQGERPHRAGDYSFNNIGLTSFLMLSSTMPSELRREKGYYTVGGCGGNIAWHTEHDLMDIADRDILWRDIKVYLACVLGVANADVLPFDWRATAAEFSRTLARYRAAAGDHVDLAPAAEALARLTRALDDFYAGIAAGTETAAAANTVIQKLARALVPLNYAKEARFRHDPALPVPPLPTIALAAELATLPPEQLGFARTTLLRGCNRLVAALEAATALVTRRGA
jgi:N-acetylated-alpha-linked acidic dipeptidase